VFELGAQFRKDHIDFVESETFSVKNGIFDIGIEWGAVGSKASDILYYIQDGAVRMASISQHIPSRRFL